jgi:hypothetical protein
MIEEKTVVDKEYYYDLVDDLMSYDSKSTEFKETRKALFSKDVDAEIFAYLTDMNNRHKIGFTKKEVKVVIDAIKVMNSDKKTVLIGKIITQQTKLKTPEINMFFDLYSDIGKCASTSMIMMTPHIEQSFKMYVLTNLLTNTTVDPATQFKHQKILFTSLDRVSTAGNKFFEEIFTFIIMLIEKNDKMSEQLVDIWSNNTTSLDEYAKKKNIESTLLYEYTKLTQYLPREAKDVFLF